ncbi:unnamed protein product [Parascedosporium putredinis]|uniref:Retrovirus-related Pol polyprotein from transposon TNT 1-94-like beta-barrel domain-containing protein n=1 Tax=Parascedosporium putredinis TaxID=1442378 RepID=A0A9P1GZD6_9PEZI|nr:unnamed protein product [Parascedosporium putredinis]CAI7991592.1 unnamed protein product [Parascedosporium putredinis]
MTAAVLTGECWLASIFCVRSGFRTDALCNYKGRHHWKSCRGLRLYVQHGDGARQLNSSQKAACKTWLQDPSKKEKALKQWKSESEGSNVVEMSKDSSDSNVRIANTLVGHRIQDPIRHPSIQPQLYSAAIDTDISLRESILYDTCATIHVFNKKSWFVSMEAVDRNMTVLVGDTTIDTKMKGTVEIDLLGPAGRQLVRIHNVYYSPGFHTNIVSGQQWL